MLDRRKALEGRELGGAEGLGGQVDSPGVADVLGEYQPTHAAGYAPAVEAHFHLPVRARVDERRDDEPNDESSTRRHRA